MSTDPIKALIYAEGFFPFRIHHKKGRTYDITNREFCWVSPFVRVRRSRAQRWPTNNGNSQSSLDRESNDARRRRAVIEQIRHLQSIDPFETFSIELTNGRIIQIHDRHQVATAKGTHHGDAVIGVLYETGTFEVLNASQIVAVSVGVHPKVKQQMAARRAEIEKSFEDEDDEL